MTGAGSFVHQKDVDVHRWEEMPLQLMPKRIPPIFTWKGNGFQETGLPRFCSLEMPALGRETMESNENTHKETKLTFLKDKSEVHGGLCGPGEKSTCKNLKKQPLCLSFQIYTMGIVKPHISQSYNHDYNEIIYEKHSEESLTHSKCYTRLLLFCH